MDINIITLRNALLKMGVKIVATQIKSASYSIEASNDSKPATIEFRTSNPPPKELHAGSLVKVVDGSLVDIIEMPTTAETTHELKQRLGKELYKLELDLQNGGRIAGKVCDCLGKKHKLGIESTAEELMSYEKNPVYGQVVSWINTHAPTFEPVEIAKRPASYYQMLTPEVRQFRKQVMGTEELSSLTSEE